MAAPNKKKRKKKGSVVLSHKDGTLYEKKRKKKTDSFVLSHKDGTLYDLNTHEYFSIKLIVVTSATS